MRFKELRLNTIEISKALENSLDIFFFENDISDIHDLLNKRDKFVNTRNVGKIRLKEFNDFIQSLETKSTRIQSIDKPIIRASNNFSKSEQLSIISYLEKNCSRRLTNILSNLIRTHKINNIQEFNSIKNNFHKIRNAGKKTIEEIKNINLENFLETCHSDLESLEFENKEFNSKIEDYMLSIETFGSERIQNRILQIKETLLVSNKTNYTENLNRVYGLGRGSIDEIFKIINSHDSGQLILNKNSNNINKKLLHFFPKINIQNDNINQDSETHVKILTAIEANSTKWNQKEIKLAAGELSKLFNFNDHISHEILISPIFKIKLFCLFWMFPNQIYYFIYSILFKDPFSHLTRERKRQILSKYKIQYPHDIYKLHISEDCPINESIEMKIPNNNLYITQISGSTVFLITKKLFNAITLIQKRRRLVSVDIRNYSTNEGTLQSYLESFYQNEIITQNNLLINVNSKNNEIKKTKIKQRIETYVELNQNYGITSEMIAKELELYGIKINKILIPNWIRKEKLNLIQKLDWTWVVFNSKFHKDLPYNSFSDYFKRQIDEKKDLFETITYLRTFYKNYRINNFYALTRLDKAAYNQYKENYILGLIPTDLHHEKTLKAIKAALRQPSAANLQLIQNNTVHFILDQWFSQFEILIVNSKTYYLSRIQVEEDLFDQTDFFKNNFRQENIIFCYNNIFLNFHGKEINIYP